MRCFLALELPKEVKDTLYKISENFDSKLAKVKWVSKKNLHLTLKFLGEISETDVEKVKILLSDKSFSSSTVSLGKVSFFPKIGNPQVIFVGFSFPGNLFDLQSDIELLLSPYFKQDERFEAHLTLGRIKKINAREAFSSYFLPFNFSSLHFPFETLTLYSSILTKEGPVYKKIQSFELKK